jgi:hypothetical protein
VRKFAVAGALRDDGLCRGVHGDQGEQTGALRWNDIHEASISIDERFCRGDWGEPKSEASCATIAVNRAVIERIHRLKLLTVKVSAGRAVRNYRVVGADWCSHAG